jgi:hypothetical protein
MMPKMKIWLTYKIHLKPDAAAADRFPPKHLKLEKIFLAQITTKNQLFEIKTSQLDVWTRSKFKFLGGKLDI